MSDTGACHACGHRHRTMASASKASEIRWFCHEDDHSCYNDRRGRYFEGRDTMSPDCRDGNHRKCYGDAWDTVEDQPTDCQCRCHISVPRP